MARLTYRQRRNLPSRDFAIPSERKYPIENKAHARDALARVSANGTKKEEREVIAAVKQRYKSIRVKLRA